MANYADSVARTLNEKLGESPSVLDFGAVRDGSTDCAQAFQDGIDAVNGRGGGALFVPRGTYALAAQIVLKDNVWLVGEGHGSTLVRDADLGSGEALISVSGSKSGIADLAIDGATTTPTVLKYSDFGLNPMADALTGNTSIWVRPGVSGFQLIRTRIFHTGGYACLIDADSADVRDVLVDGCLLEYNRPHIWKTEDNAHQFGSWTGGIFYRGDCRASESKLFAVRGLTVRGSSFRRGTGNQVWGHSWGFDVQHAGIIVTDNYFEAIGRDAVLFGNVLGGTCAGNVMRQIGYLATSDAGALALIAGGDLSVGVDSSGFVSGVDYSRNTVTDSPRGEGFDLDGFRDGSLYGNQVKGCLIAINCGDTANNGAGRRIAFIGNVIEGCSYSSIRLNDCEDCSVVGNTIDQPDTATEAPVQFNALTADGVKGNLVTGNRIHWDKDDWCVKEAAVGGSYSSAAENRVFNNQISGSNRGEFYKHEDSASTAAQILSTTDPTATEPSEQVLERVGFDAGAAFRIATRVGGVRTEVAQLQDANRLLLVGLAAGEGALATGDRSALIWGNSPDAVATGKVYADGFITLVGKDIDEPGWASTYDDAQADAITTDQVALLRYNATTKALEQSTAVSGGSRVWAPFGAGTIAGTAHQITVSAGVASLASNGVRIQAATGITDAVLRIRGELAQAVALQEWRKNDETVLAAVDAYGTMFSPAFAARTDTWAPGGSDIEGTYAAREIRFRQNSSSEEANSGLISFRQAISGGLAIYGAGAVAGDRLIYLLDRVGVNGKAANPAIVVASGYIDSDEGFYTGDNATNAIQAPIGGVTARYLIGTRSLTMTADTAANAGLSTTGNGRLYFDSSANKFKVSENGGAYVDLIGSGGTPGGSTTQVQYNNAGAFGGSANFVWNNAGQALTITGTATSAAALNVLSGYVDSAGGFNTASANTNAIQAASGGVTARFLVATRSLSLTGDTAANAGLSSAGNGRIYFDSSANVFKVSENGGAYVNLLGSVSGSFTSGRIPYATGASSLADSASLAWNNGAQALTITGTSTGAAALNVLSGYVDSAGGFNTSATASNAIQAASGGVTARFLVATRSLSMTGDTAVNAGLSTTGNGRLYFDSSANVFKVSENGGAYVNLVAAIGGSNGHVQFNNSGAFGGSANFNWNNGSQILTITGSSNASPSLTVATGYVDAVGGFNTSATGTNAIQAASGGVTARFLVATRSLSMTGDTAVNAGLSTTGNGRIYFDSSASKFKVSENGGAYVDLIGSGGITGSLTSGRIPYATGASALSDSANLTWNNAGQALTITGSALTNPALNVATGYVDSAGGFNTASSNTNAIQATTGGVTARFMVATRSFSMTGDTSANAGASTAGNGRIYFDSSANKFKVSENGGAYVDMILSNRISGSLTSGRVPYASGANALSDSANLAWNNGSQVLTITGTSTAAAALAVASGYVDSAGGFNTSATATNAIQAASGGVTARFLVGTRSFSMTGDTAANAGASTAGNGRIYFDSSANVFKVSENGGAYVNLIGGGLSGLTSGRIPYTTGASSIADTGNLTWNNTTRTLGISAQTNATPAIDATQGYISAAGGLLSTATNFNSIQAAGGIRTGDGSAGVVGKVYINFSSLFNNDVNIYGRAISGVNGVHAQQQSGQAAAIMDVYGAGIPAFVGRRANGTIASPSQTLSGDYIMAMGGRGWFSGASDFTSSFTCAVLFAASENWTSIAQGSHIEFATTPIGSTSRSPRMTVRGAGQIEIGSSGNNGILALYGTGSTPGINPNSSYGGLSYKSSSTYYYWNGSAWAEYNFAAAGGGITSINSQTGSSITIQGTSLEVDVASGSNIITIGLPNSVLVSNQLQVNGATGSAIYAPFAYIQGKGIISSGLAAWNAMQSDGGVAASTSYGFSLISGVTQYQAIDYSGGARFVGAGGVSCTGAGIAAAGFNPYYLAQYTGYSSDTSFGAGDTIQIPGCTQFFSGGGSATRTVQFRFTRGALTYFASF